MPWDYAEDGLIVDLQHRFRRRLSVVVAAPLLAAAMFTAATTANPSSAGAATFYCNEVVAPSSDCPQHLNTNEWNTNQAYIPQNNYDPVCERATIRYHAANISYRCGDGPTDSQCDLYIYAGDVLSMYVSNDLSTGSFAEYMVGKGYNTSYYCV